MPENSPIRRIKDRLRGWRDALWTSDDPTMAELGGESPWWIKPDLLRPGAVVISGGMGKDVSFERELAQHYGCRVFAFDPSPTGMKTMSRRENQHANIEYFPLGLAASVGTTQFNSPQNPGEGSYSLATDAAKADTVNFGCTTVSEFARTHDLKRIDVLKLDIEGFEYQVLDDVLDARLRIAQICVEYHHFMPGISFRQTLRSLWRLWRGGFVLMHKKNNDYLFIARWVMK